jgi:hypothetical protein
VPSAASEKSSKSEEVHGHIPVHIRQTAATGHAVLGLVGEPHHRPDRRFVYVPPAAHLLVGPKREIRVLVAELLGDPLRRPARRRPWRGVLVGAARADDRCVVGLELLAAEVLVADQRQKLAGLTAAARDHCPVYGRLCVSRKSSRISESTLPVPRIRACERSRFHSERAMPITGTARLARFAIA